MWPNLNVVTESLSKLGSGVPRNNRWRANVSNRGNTQNLGTRAHKLVHFADFVYPYLMRGGGGTSLAEKHPLSSILRPP